jgi:hypothetical protein
MNQKSLRTIALRSFVLVGVLGAAWQTHAQDSKTYPSRAPLDQYLIADANAEMVLARSAAPDSISRDAEVMVLGRREIDLAGSPISHWKALFRSPW